MEAVGWRWKHPSQGYLRIPVSPNLAWNHGTRDMNCNRWGRSVSAGASAEIIYRTRMGEGKEGQVGRELHVSRHYKNQKYDDAQIRQWR